MCTSGYEFLWEIALGYEWLRVSEWIFTLKKVELIQAN